MHLEYWQHVRLSYSEMRRMFGMEPGALDMQAVKDADAREDKAVRSTRCPDCAATWEYCRGH